MRWPSSVFVGLGSANSSGRRLQKARRLVVRLQQHLGVVAQRLVAVAGGGQIRRTGIHGQRPRTVEHVLQARPRLARVGHVRGFYVAPVSLEAVNR